MKIKLFKLLAGLSGLSATAALACSLDAKQGIFPENDLYIPDSRFSFFAISENEFNAANAKMQALYAPVFQAQGRTLKIEGDWKDGTVNAYANRSGNVSEVHMFGGLARHPKMTPDAFMLVLCHETGHHLGGAPKTTGIWGGGELGWASNEGESDYFSTLKCAREVWKDEDNRAVISQMQVPAKVLELCQKSFDKTEEISICQRSAMAGKSLADTLSELSKTAETSFENPDTNVTSRMVSSHPPAQCRLDTYMAGALCTKSKDEPLSDRDPTVGTCAQEKGDVVGVRPLCWYLPMPKPIEEAPAKRNRAIESRR